MRVRERNRFDSTSQDIDVKDNDAEFKRVGGQINEDKTQTSTPLQQSTPRSAGVRPEW